ncbi:TPA: hypothetical protein ACTYHK_001664 [Citrobacter koseri]|nr:hypothetical protein [Citrobacter koseri]HEM6838320.1 hypothetical protein [Citrobacter koseri]HEM8007213.1 hypothetical protein [Citrobacter koseri]HEM8525087.1 hypothetical protein [Citrobacter koseri]
MTDKLLSDDVKIIRRQISEDMPYGEVINFMVNQLGLTHKEAVAAYEELSGED